MSDRAPSEADGGTDGGTDDAADDAIAIAVDGGGSKTDAVALDRHGRVLARARAAGSSPHIIGMAATLTLIDELVRGVIAEAGGRQVGQVNIYLSGLDLPVEVESFASSIAAFDWATGASGRPAVIDNDLFALLRAGADEPNAVAVVCGTGINCVGVTEDGATVRYPALGMISGDWGGGWHLGEQALWHASRAADGRGPATALTRLIPEALGLGSVREVIEALHFDRIASASLSALSPAVFRASREGDAVAGTLVDTQAHEIALIAETTLRHLGLLERQTPVVLGGGIIIARDARLMTGIESELARRAPLARIRVVTVPPILGAGLLALESLGADPAAVARARHALGAAEPRLTVA